MVWVPLIFSCVMYRRTVLSMEAQFKRASALSRLVSMEVATSRRLNSAACRELARTYWLERMNSAAPTASEVRKVKKRIPHTICRRSGKRWLLFITVPPFR